MTKYVLVSAGEITRYASLELELGNTFHTKNAVTVKNDIRNNSATAVRDS